MTAPELWFYHLETQPLHIALPLLVQKTLAKGWRALLRFTTAERMDAVDSALWTYRDESFLPHGTARDGDPAQHPVFLTLDPGNSNRAEALFLLETATEANPAEFLRVIRVFDDADDEAKAVARSDWRSAKVAGGKVSYWQQDKSGVWKKSA
jgi:DNA polymerase III subunit chi